MAEVVLSFSLSAAVTIVIDGIDKVTLPLVTDGGWLMAEGGGQVGGQNDSPLVVLYSEKVWLGVLFNSRRPSGICTGP